MKTKDDAAPEYGNAAHREAEGKPLSPIDSALLRSVQVRIEARLGELAMTIEELMELKAGSALAFDRKLNEPIDIFLNGALVARGEIVAVDDHFGVRIVEIADIR